MVDKTRLRADILGRKFNIVSNENAQYVMKIIKDVDSRMKKFKEENPKFTFDYISVLTCLNLCDELNKLKFSQEDKENVENNSIRGQLMEYSKELSKAEMTIKRLEREMEEIKRESMEKEENLKREYAAKEKEILDMLESM